jgi:hypothetical protein
MESSLEIAVKALIKWRDEGKPMWWRIPPNGYFVLPREVKTP